MKICSPKNWLSGSKSAVLFITLLLFNFASLGQSVPSFSLQDKGCVGSSVSLVNTTVAMAGDTLTYNWVISDTTTVFSSMKNPIHTWQSMGNYNIRLITENQHGDTASVSKSISIKQVPLSNFTWDQACKNVPIQFLGYDYSVDTFGVIDYTWNFGDTAISSQSVDYLYDSVGVKNVSLEVNSDYGCRDTLLRTVEVLEFIPVDFSFSDVCQGDSVCFTNLTGDSTKDYRWSMGDGLDYTDKYHVCHTYQEALAYNVSLEIKHKGCSDIIYKQIVVNELPNASFTFTSNGRTVEFDGPSGNDEYRWIFGDGGRDQSEDPTYTYGNIEGDEVICLQTKKGVCWSEECQNLWSFGSVLSNEKLQWRMYPNPSNGIFNIELASYDDLILIDALGKILSPTLIKAESGYRLDLNVFPSGVYTVKVIDGDALSTKQVVLMK